jgi:superoxide dismutase, Cu-Zn family
MRITMIALAAFAISLTGCVGLSADVPTGPAPTAPPAVATQFAEGEVTPSAAVQATAAARQGATTPGVPGAVAPAAAAEEGTPTPATADPAAPGDLSEMGAMSEGVLAASAQLQNIQGEVIGTAAFRELADGSVEITVAVNGLEVAQGGEHGIHVHAQGACTPDFDAAGPHFNPTGAQHGLENPQGPHAGDLPNIEISADGIGSYQTVTTMFTLSPGPLSILSPNAALVIHANPDDHVTDPDGNSGERIACGVIMPELVQ